MTKIAADYDREAEDWFTTLLLKTGTCFERDVLRDNKVNLKTSFIRRTRAIDERMTPKTEEPQEDIFTPVEADGVFKGFTR